MQKNNFINENELMLERPNLREECNITTDKEMENYLIAYNVYSNLLIQYMSKKFYLLNADKELEKHNDIFSEIKEENKDLYQHSSTGYLKYYYIRNNIHIERLSQEELKYLYDIYNSNNLHLTKEREEFIENTYLNVIVEINTKDVSVNYGPDDKQFIKPSNAIIIGVRYNEFKNIDDSSNSITRFINAEGKIQILNNFLEYKVRKENSIPFFVIKYNDYSIKKHISVSK